MKLATFVEKRYLVERALRPNSEYQVRRSVAIFSEWLGRDATQRDLTNTTVSLFLKESEAAYCPKSLHRIRGDVMAVWRHMAGDPGSRLIPPSRVRKLRVPRRAPKAWTAEEVARLVAACKELPERRNGTLPGPYFAALICAAWDTGLRKSDLFALRHGDIRAEGSISITQEKTSNVINVRLRADTVRLIKLIREPYPLMWKGANRMLYVWFDKIKKLAGIVTPGYLQRVRRSAASEIEKQAPGMAGHFLGHLTPGLAYKHYVDRSIAVPELLQPRQLPKEKRKD